MRKTNISLLGFLAVVACVAIGISHALTTFQLYRANTELYRADTELATLHQRLDLIPVDDSSHVAARRRLNTFASSLVPRFRRFMNLNDSTESFNFCMHYWFFTSKFVANLQVCR